MPGGSNFISAMELPRATVVAAIIVGLCSLLASFLSGRHTAEKALEPEIRRQDENLNSLQGQLQQTLALNQELRNRLMAEERRLGDLSAEVEKLNSPSLRPSPPAPLEAKTQEGAKPQEQENPVVIGRQFQFALDGCSRSGSSVRVKCRLIVTNLSGDKRPLLFNPMYYMGGRVSFLSDRDGVHYGANVERNAVDNALNPAPELVPNVPAAFSLTFDNVPTSLKSAILVIEADEGALGKNIEVTFPEIQLR